MAQESIKSRLPEPRPHSGGSGGCRRCAFTVSTTIIALLSGYAGSHASATPWEPSHVVVVMEENQSYGQIIGNPGAPFINALAMQGALFTDAHGVRHPSQPNYLAIFSGSTQGVSDDNAVPGTPLKTANLGSELIAHGRTFIGYCEDLPSMGSTALWAHGVYARKHNPWSNWQSANPQQNQLPSTTNQTFNNFPSNFEQLPTVAFIIPNMSNDEHGTGKTPIQMLIKSSDTWLKEHLGPYAEWAKNHDSLLVITWDEDNNTAENHFPTILYGARVRPGRYEQRIDHYNILRMIEEFYGLNHIGASKAATPIVGAIP